MRQSDHQCKELMPGISHLPLHTCSPLFPGLLCAPGGWHQSLVSIPSRASGLVAAGSEVGVASLLSGVLSTQPCLWVPVTAPSPCSSGPGVVLTPGWSFLSGFPPPSPNLWIESLLLHSSLKLPNLNVLSVSCWTLTDSELIGNLRIIQSNLLIL